MRCFVIIALAMCQLCACAVLPSQSSVTVLSADSTDSCGRKTSVVYCGPLVCPSNANTCAVSKRSNADLTKIITKRECKRGKEVLLSETNEEDNWSRASLNSYATTSIGAPSAEDQQRAQKAVPFGFDASNQIQNSIRNHIANQFRNIRTLNNSPVYSSFSRFSFNSPDSNLGYF